MTIYFVHMSFSTEQMILVLSIVVWCIVILVAHIPISLKDRLIWHIEINSGLVHHLKLS